MPYVPLLEPQHASPESQTVYEEFHTRMAFPAPPNFIKTQGHSPTVVRGTWEAVRNVLVLGEIPRWTKEIIFVAISKDRGCRYCTAAHIACCRVLGVSPQLLEDMVRDLDSLPEERLRAIVKFAVKCSRDPQGLTETDFEQLRRHGLGHPEIVEVIAMSAFAVYANIIADATAMNSDEMFGSIGK